MRKILIFGLIALGLTSCGDELQLGDLVYVTTEGGFTTPVEVIFGKVVVYEAGRVIVKTCDGQYVATAYGSTYLARNGEVCR